MKKINTAVLIDDNPIDQRIYEKILMRSGLVNEVIVFSLAQPALDFLRTSPDRQIDVIFLDINMPMMDGFQFLEAATAEFDTGFTRIVVAMLTTSLNPSDKERARKFSVVREYITKPLTKQHIEDIANILD
ncbi:MAG: response regulator [Pseudomonadota bacterium]